MRLKSCHLGWHMPLFRAFMNEVFQNKQYWLLSWDAGVDLKHFIQHLWCWNLENEIYDDCIRTLMKLKFMETILSSRSLGWLFNCNYTNARERRMEQWSVLKYSKYTYDLHILKHHYISYFKDQLQDLV